MTIENTEEELLLRIAVAGQKLSVSRSKLYELIARGEVPYVKIGGSLRIPLQALKAWIEKNTDGNRGVL
jgi:excisionase family DNA binding protein